MRKIRDTKLLIRAGFSSIALRGIFLALLSPAAGLLAAPPTVQNHTINQDGDGQRSQIASLAFTFDQDVSESLDAEDLVLSREGNPLSEGTAALTYIPASNLAVWTFPNLQNQVLPDGNYTATLLGLNVENAAGELLDGQGQNNPGSDYVFQFFSLKGDLDGDRDVDFLDTCILRDALGTSTNSPDFEPGADFDVNGTIGDPDVAIYREHFLDVLPPPPAIPRVDASVTETDQGTVTLTGEADPNTPLVIVNGDQTTVVTTEADGTFSAEVPLNSNGINHIAVNTITTNGIASVAIPVTISQDVGPPFLSLLTPLDGSQTFESEIPVSGFVGDMISGYEGLMVVIDNGGLSTNATITPGIGANGRFDLESIPLLPGPNDITVTATDRLGNSTSIVVTVTRENFTGGEPRLVEISGNLQMAPRDTELPEPLVIQVVDGAGDPIAGQVVTFAVERAGGTLFHPEDVNDDPQIVQTFTDSNGIMSVTYLLGSEAGPNIHWARATAEGVDGEVLFRATALPGPPSQIDITMGDNQRGEAGSRAMENLRVWVHDGLNGIPDVPVNFQIKQGNGRVDGLQFATVLTDQTGHANIPFTYGLFGGIQTINANFIGNLEEGVTFTLFGVRRTEDLPTTFNGIVLDNSNLPIGGAEVILSSGSTAFPMVKTGPDGVFQVTDILPGAAHLRVIGSPDGGGITLDGEPVDAPRYPDLAYSVTVVANAANKLPVPVWLPPLNPVNKVVYDGTSPITLTVQGLEGVEFSIEAGSVTLADGSMPSPDNPVTLSLDQVHVDNLPMPLPDGIAFLFAWTLQPPSMILNPPATVQLPNFNALAPGASANVLSFNHDTERFEVIANARINSDGSLLKTLPGEGVGFSGWGGACPPYTFGEDIGMDGNDDGTNGVAMGETGDHHCGGEGDVPGTVGDPVFIGTGEVYANETDLAIPGRGIDFKWTRSYRSRYSYDGPMGYGWDHAYNRRLDFPEDPEEGIRLMNGDARVDTYEPQFDGTYISPRGFFNKLIPNPDGTYTLRERDGFKSIFNARGQLTAQQDRNGNQLQFRYDDGRLDFVIDTMGRVIDIIHQDNGRIAGIRDFMGREVRYTYNGNGDLVAVRSPVVVGTSNGNDFPEGKTTRYSYYEGYEGDRLEELNHNLATITDPKGQTYVSYQYYTDPNDYQFDRVVTHRWGGQDQFMSFSYAALNTNAPPNAALARVQTTVFDRNGNQVVYLTNEGARIIEKRVRTNRNINPDDPEEFVTSYTFNKDGLQTSITYPEGNTDTFVYDEDNTDRYQQGNLLRIVRTPGARPSDQNRIVTSYTYEPVFNQVRTITEPRGNDTSYNPQNGGAQSADRYTKTFFYDYEEGDNLVAIATELGGDATGLLPLLVGRGMQVNAGDLNGDGQISPVAGNVIGCRYPDVLLVDGTTQEIIEDYHYNPFGQKTKSIDPEGNVTVMRYHPESDPDGDGAGITGGRDTQTGGYLSTTIVDAEDSPRRTNPVPPVAIRSERFYDPVGNLIRSVDGRGNDTILEVNELNQVVSCGLEQPFRFETRFFYDANDNVTRKEVANVDVNGPDLDGFVTTDYEYNILNDRTATHREVSTKLTLTTRFDYDRNQNLTRVTQPEGNVVFTRYDERDLPYTITRGFESDEASTITMTYDGNGSLAQLLDAADNNGDGQGETTIYRYDGYDRQVSVIDAVGNETRTTYDPLGNIVDRQRYGPLSGPSRANNAIAGNVTLERKESSFDELGRPFQTDTHLFANNADVGPEGPLTPGDGKVTTQVLYDRDSRQVAFTDDNIHSRFLEYDGADRLVRSTDPVGNVREMRYDENSNPVRITETDISPEGVVPDEVFVTRHVYDNLDRLTATTDNLSNTSRFFYDSRNNRTGITDNLGNTTESIYDGINRLLATHQDLRVGGTGAGGLDTSNPENPDGRNTVSREWDGNSRLAALIDDKGNRTGYGYDALDRKVVERFADDTSKRYSYDADNNLRRLTDQNGSVHTRTYDGIHRLVRREIVRGTGVFGTTLQTFEYDGLSRNTLATDNNDPDNMADDSTLIHRYDSLSRVLEEEQNGRVVGSSYDGVGNMLACTYPNGRVVTTSYDDNDRMKRITEDADGSMIAEYDYLGNRHLERRHGNGTRMTFHNGAGDANGYDGLRRNIRVVHRNANGDRLMGFAYGYDKMHNRRYELDLEAQTADTYQYDSAYRLVDAQYETPRAGVVGLPNNEITNTDVAGLAGIAESLYTLDGIGNWAAFTEAGSTQSVTINEMNEYAAVGPTARSHDENGNLRINGDSRYRYDALNRLVLVRPTSARNVETYAYDGLNRRVERFAEGRLTTYLYTDDHVCEELENGSTARQFVYGSFVDEAIQLQSSGDAYFYMQDSLGSTKGLSDAAGSVVERYSYTAYGSANITDASGAIIDESLIGNPFAFTGRRLESATGLYYYRARFYSPESGRFLQRDPLGYMDSMSLYGYANQNPINYIDPSGELAPVIVFAIQAARIVGTAWAAYEGAKYTMDAAGIVSDPCEKNKLAALAGITAPFAVEAVLSRYKILERLAASGNRLAGRLWREVVGSNRPGRPDFYVRPDGTVVPSTGYRHVSSEAEYLNDLVNSGEIPANPDGTYFSFDEFTDAAQASDALQVPHDAGIQVEFDTLQNINDYEIPMGGHGAADYKEPFTQDFPQFGSGGASQVITTGAVDASQINNLITGETLYKK